MSLDQPLTLPCGAILPNRLAKAAMSEHLASRRQDPTAGLERLYATWARGRIGLVITGNVMVDRSHVESTRNVVADADANAEKWAAWARAATAHGTPAWVQLNHPGRQTPRHVAPEPVAPSALEPVALLRRAGAFGRSRALTHDEIEAIVQAFADAARLCQRSGFTGVQIHGAHGYLVSQFLSPRTNLRTDGWGGDLQGRARFLRAIVREVRQAVGPTFPVGVKLNSADFQKGGFDEGDSLEVLRMLSQDGVDLVEISGGSYEAQAMFDQGAPSVREAYFLDYARRAREATTMPLMVTGGFRSRDVMRRAIDDDGIDVVGMARPFTERPDIAGALLDGSAVHATAPRPIPGLAFFGGVSEAMMCVVQMGLLANGQEPSPRWGRWQAILRALGQEIKALRR